MRALILLALGLAVAIAGTSAKRIVGGSTTTIGQYPYAVALLRLSPTTGNFGQSCGGTIINNRSILSAAHCFLFPAAANQWRGRVGSTTHNSGGVVHNINSIIRHGSFSPATLNNDIAILRINGAFSFNNNVRAASIAGSNYNVPDNAWVWAIGWGATSYHGPGSVQLRHVQVQAINQAVCISRYAPLGITINDNMWCSGILNTGGRDACTGDSGGPVIHNGIVAGITSGGEYCADGRFPGTNVRVSRYTSWINNNR